MKQLMLIEEFQNCIPDDMRIHLTDKKAETAIDIATAADEYILTHKRSRAKLQGPMQSQVREHCAVKTLYENPRVPIRNPLNTTNRPVLGREARPIVCFNCGKPGHVAAKCQAKRFTEMNRNTPAKPQGAISQGIDETYEPFISKGYIARDKEGQGEPINILRDTGASQSLVKRGCMPKEATRAAGRATTIRGMKQTHNDSTI